MSKLTYTIAISTRKAPESIIRTVNSLLGSKKAGKFRFVIVCDEMSNVIKAEVTEKGVEVIENHKDKSLAEKLNQIIKLVDTDLVVLTQDDLIFDPLTIHNIVLAFKKNKLLTTTFCNEVPFPPTSFFQKAIQNGLYSAYYIAQNWKQGDNFLSSNGRCIGLRTSFAKNIKFPLDVINVDIFLYFLTKTKGGFSKRVTKAYVGIKSPSTLKDHISQSTRFQFAKREVQKYLKVKDSEFVIPFTVSLHSFAIQFMKAPVETIAYLAIHLYSRVIRKDYRAVITPFWRIDVSTKL